MDRYKAFISYSHAGERTAKIDTPASPHAMCSRHPAPPLAVWLKEI